MCWSGNGDGIQFVALSGSMWFAFSGATRSGGDNRIDHGWTLLYDGPSRLIYGADQKAKVALGAGSVFCEKIPIRQPTSAGVQVIY